MASRALTFRLLRLDSLDGRILHAAAWVAAMSVVVKLAATGKEMVVAGIYARSDAMDAFLAASLIPALLVNLISESMNQALIPTLVRVRKQEGRASAEKLLSTSMLSTVVLLVCVSILMAASAGPVLRLVGSKFAAEKLALSVHLFYGLLPTVLLAGVATNCTAVLNTWGKFAAPALAPAIVPLTTIAGAVLLAPQMGIWALVIATVAGSLLHALVISSSMHAHAYRLRLRWFRMSKAAREVTQQYSSVFLSSVVASGGLLVDQAMSASLAAGSISALVYGSRFVNVAVTLMAGSVSTAITPHFSELIAARDWRGCRRSVRNWTKLTALVSIPIALLMIFAARPIVHLAFEHGAFGSRDTSAVAPVMAMYAIQIPFIVVSRVFYRFIVAMRRTDLTLACGVINLALDVVLNIVLMRSMGVAGIALATSFWTVSTFFFLGYWCWKLLRHTEDSGPVLEARAA